MANLRTPLAWCVLLVASLLVSRSSFGQAWLYDQSLGGSAYEIPTVPSLPEGWGGAEQVPSPALSAADLSEGLFEVPPPLRAEMPASLIAPSSVESMPEGPIWYYPWTWIPRNGWKNSAELGVNGSAGNAESMSFQVGSRFNRKTDLTQFDLRISHNRTTNGGLETQNNALMYADFERFLGDSPWNYFLKNGLEYDEFRAFDVRYNVNTGLGYSFVRTDDLTLVGRFGAGASREIGGPDDRWVPEALFGGDYEHQVNQRNKLIFKVDYFPEWGDFTNYRLVSDMAWEYLVDETGNLSLKLGAVDRYDSTPNGLKPNDINYSALLLYKF